MKKVEKGNFPPADCEYGYSWDYLKEILDPKTFSDFSIWMRGQTCSLCEGRQYNHELHQYEPSACVENPHGPIAYSWDVKRFLGFYGQAVKDIWD